MSHKGVRHTGFYARIRGTSSGELAASLGRVAEPPRSAQVLPCRFPGNIRPAYATHPYSPQTQARKEIDGTGLASRREWNSHRRPRNDTASPWVSGGAADLSYGKYIGAGTALPTGRQRGQYDGRRRR